MLSESRPRHRRRVSQFQKSTCSARGFLGVAVRIRTVLINKQNMIIYIYKIVVATMISFSWCVHCTKKNLPVNFELVTLPLGGRVVFSVQAVRVKHAPVPQSFVDEPGWVLLFSNCVVNCQTWGRVASFSRASWEPKEIQGNHCSIFDLWSVDQAWK